jgi:hypothetical protein
MNWECQIVETDSPENFQSSLAPRRRMAGDLWHLHDRQVQKGDPWKGHVALLGGRLSHVDRRHEARNQVTEPGVTPSRAFLVGEPGRAPAGAIWPAAHYIDLVTKNDRPREPLSLRIPWSRL